MVRRSLTFARLAVIVACLSGCSLGKMSGMSPRPAGQAPEKRQVAITATEEQRSGVRARERQALEQKIQQRRADFMRDAMEQNARNAIALTLGQRAAASESASTSIRALRAAGVRLRVDTARDPFELVAEAEEAPRVGRRGARAKKEAEAEAPPPNLDGLRQQLVAVSRAAKAWNDQVQLDGLQYIGPVATMVLSRKKMGFELDDGDYEVVRAYLEMARVDEAIAASMLALLATIQAAVVDGADPKTIDTVAESASQAFPIRATVTIDDAKAYVAQLRDPIARMKTRYEVALRKSVGNEPYEKAFKPKVDAAFAAFVDRPAGRPDVTADQLPKVDTRVLEDAQRCKPGARCDDLRRTATMGDSARASKETALPGGNAITASIEGIRASKRGDARGALTAAIALEPVPGLKRVFSETLSQ